MGKEITITDDKKRDAAVAIVSPKRKPPVRYLAQGAQVRADRLIRGTDETSHEALARTHGTPEAIARAIAESDPEIPLELVGRRVGPGARVYLRDDGTLLGIAQFLEVVTGTDGAEKSRKPFVDVEANVGGDAPALPWTGKLMPIDEAVRKFAFVRKVQLRHVSGLTYEFLLDIAKKLAADRKMLVVGSGPKGGGPLIFGTNGTSYRGFLEGRVEGDAFSLVLHLSNLELKTP
jgi:hypothetical protein